ncbi:hypothetical protein Tcan_13224 [Toxocara canis]|uniref:Uncharacterized protein n=1 Tax=Toxocara canis TaxID=6265 RepID=A0A0B2W438_TOXCA|nr:hypothetical protein Tcan_13224 [Toxocara canis]
MLFSTLLRQHNALYKAVISHGWNVPWGRYWGTPRFDWGYGHGSDVSFNKGIGDEFEASAAQRSKSDWGNYNYGGHGDYAREASFATGLQHGAGKAYENGWGNGWGCGAHAFQFPWGLNDYRVIPHSWWLH